MIRRLALIIASVFVLAIPAQAASSTTPARVPSGVFWPYTHNVAATVTTDGPATIEMITTAYRHAPAVRARLVVAEATTVTITASCRPYLLPMTWTVFVNGVKVGFSATLKCR